MGTVRYRCKVLLVLLLMGRWRQCIPVDSDTYVQQQQVVGHISRDIAAAKYMHTFFSLFFSMSSIL